MWSQRGFKKLCILKKRLPVISHTQLYLGAGKAYYILEAMGQECRVPMNKYHDFINDIKTEI